MQCERGIAYLLHSTHDVDSGSFGRFTHLPIGRHSYCQSLHLAAYCHSFDVLFHVISSCENPWTEQIIGLAEVYQMALGAIGSYPHCQKYEPRCLKLMKNAAK